MPSYHDCGVIYRLKQHFNRDTALKYYYSYVYGTIRYCLANYGGVAMCTRRCQRVESLQKRIVENLFRNLSKRWMYLQRDEVAQIPRYLQGERFFLYVPGYDPEICPMSRESFESWSSIALPRYKT